MRLFSKAAKNLYRRKRSWWHWSPSSRLSLQGEGSPHCPKMSMVPFGSAAFRCWRKPKRCSTQLLTMARRVFGRGTESSLLRRSISPSSRWLRLARAPFFLPSREEEFEVRRDWFCWYSWYSGLSRSSPGLQLLGTILLTGQKKSDLGLNVIVQSMKPLASTMLVSTRFMNSNSSCLFGGSKNAANTHFCPGGFSRGGSVQLLYPPVFQMRASAVATASGSVVTWQFAGHSRSLLSGAPGRPNWPLK
mmetsp:Transcript_121628/g.378569  ORF Transcript_121628/g.378569 Transcript_121628/m.378569 type:complete len:247 (+) Transcript_121628:578-1318(+)